MNALAIALAVASSLVTPESRTEKSYEAYVAELTAAATSRPPVSAEFSAFQTWSCNFPAK